MIPKSSSPEPTYMAMSLGRKKKNSTLLTGSMTVKSLESVRRR
ncbi:Uncharacterised protein [Mycobacterium tuberculosis]|nr:Uncharacterised protein [Mycobacterium tuberculosis]CPB43981.1 Uncharacterised protein [Mycobacterium tuberculosis]